MDLSQDSIPGLVRKLAIPASIGMMFSVLLNVVDTFYAGWLSSTAQAALSLSGPVFFLVITIGIGVGQATNALVGNRLGAKETAAARKLAMQCLSFALLFSLLAAIAGAVGTPWLFSVMGGEEPYLTPAKQYMYVVLAGTVFFTLSIVANSILNTRGDTHSYRNAQIAAFVANIFLDPLFIFVFKLGVVGIAVATIFVQMGVFIYVLNKVRKLDFMESPKLRELVPDIASYLAILRQSLPNCISMFLIAVGGVIIIAYVTRFGEAAVAAYGIALRIEQVFLLPGVGLNIAALSLTGVNFGAQNSQRIQQTFSTVLKYGLGVMLAGGIFVAVMGRLLMAVFSNDPEVIDFGVTYLYFEAAILPAYAVTFCAAAVITGLKKPEIALYFNILRQVVLQLIFFYIVVDIFNSNITGIWWSVLFINWLLALAIYWVVRARVRGVNTELAAA